MTPVPEEVAQALAGAPQVGAWDPMFELATVDPDGAVRVCQLSRAELEADEAEVRAVIASRHTVSNLRRSGRASLVVIASEAAWSCTLRLARAQAEDDGRLAAAFAIASVKRDAVGVALRPPSFLPTAEIARAEDWARSARMLATLATQPVG